MSDFFSTTGSALASGFSITLTVSRRLLQDQAGDDLARLGLEDLASGTSR